MADVRAFALVVLAALAPARAHAAVPADAREAATGTVVFVLDRDAPGARPYYALAEAYYRQSAPEAAMVTTARSLAEVREYLVRRRGAMPWSHVVLVTHGSPWAGMSVPVHAGGEPASLQELREAAVDGAFPPVPAGTLAAQARITLESCALGRRQDVVDAFVRLVAGDDTVPTVDAARGFVAFHQDAGGRVERRVMDAELAVLPARGSQLPAERVAQLGRELGAALAAVSVQTHPVRVRVDYADAPPAAANAARLARNDERVRAQLEEIGLRADELHWRLERDGAGHRIFGEGLVVVAREGWDAAAP